MLNGGESADRMVDYTLKIGDTALRLSGTAAKNLKWPWSIWLAEIWGLFRRSYIVFCTSYEVSLRARALSSMGEAPIILL